MNQEKAKVKALSLFHKHSKMWSNTPEDVKKHCLVTVDEILSIFLAEEDNIIFSDEIEFFNKIKEEINKL